MAVFREVRRVLRPDGTLWLEVGDSYASTAPGTWDKPDTGTSPKLKTSKRFFEQAEQRGNRYRPKLANVKPKDLILAPAMLAMALRADGWYLRADIIWARPNPMPESVTDRPTKSHSYVFLLAKQPRYYWDAEAVREPSEDREGRVLSGNAGGSWRKDFWTGRLPDSRAKEDGAPLAGRNSRSVWTISTQPFPEAHFATFPEALARRCILAGTSERGCCPECGAPWVRETELDESVKSESQLHKERHGHKLNATPRNPDRVDGGGMTQGGFGNPTRRTTGWRPSCGVGGYRSGVEVVEPCVVLDPFVGSGTVPYVARLHGRHSIGIDLNADYLDLAAKRLAQQSLFAQVP